VLAVVTRPRAASALAGLVVAVAAASVLLSAAWLGLPAAGAALAALALLVGLLHSLRGGLSPVSALRASPEGGRWQLRLPSGWRDAGLLRWSRGPAWLTLTLQPLPSGSMAFTRSNYTFTVWRRALRPDAWRRLCLLLAQAEPRAAAPAAPREAQ
jgi:hypothetical protein